MNRRTIVVGGVSVLVFGAVGLGAFVGTGPGAASLRELRDRVASLELDGLELAGSWTTPQVLVHLARSIEYSLEGFPRSKGAAFQATVGTMVFAAFSAREQMFHGLDTLIDGAPPLPDDVEPEEARARLLAAIDRFSSFDGALQPHFAYGSLSRDDYALAHALHLENHLG